MTRPVVVVDWDDTLAAYAKWPELGEWLPGALAALHKLSGRATVIVCSARADNPDQASRIRARLDAAKLSKVKIHAGNKPAADLYVDDRALRFTDWAETFPEILSRIR